VARRYGVPVTSITLWALDGGRILRAFLWRRTGDRVRAAQSAAAAGRAVGGALNLPGL
jgi:Zn-dependent protease